MDGDDRLALNQMANGIASHSSDHNINVVIRVRPIITSQHSPSQPKSADSKKYGVDCDQSTAIKFPAAGQIEVDDTIANTLRSFAFNVVFEPEATQEEVFEHSGVKRLIDMALDGFACTIFAYGQTSTGKTYTLTGNAFQLTQERTRSTVGSSRRSKKYSNKITNSGNEMSADDEAHTAKNIGVVQLSFAYLFEQIKRRKLRDKTLYVITVSYLEVYNEQVLDLLNPSPRCLNVRWAKDRGFYAENLFKVECEDLGDLEGVLEEGCKNRQVRSHSMNENSSRSHSVMTITLSSEMPDPEDPQGFIRKEGRFCLVDLAGSEKTKRTNSRGGTFVEANNINRSLLVLGNCIACLSDPKRRNGHIPYRDSTLTKLLADSLSGNGMTLMIACISPLKCDSQETISTLRYAMRAKRVRMNPVVQMDPRELLILSLKREVRLLRMENNYLRQNYHQMWTNSQQPPIEPVDMNALSNHSEIKAGEEDKDGQLLNKYMRENEVLRVENVQLNLQRNRLVRDHELVCRENEQLLKRLQSLMGKLNTTDGKQPLPINLQHNPALFSSASSPSIFSLVSDEDSKPSKARVNSFSHGLNEKPSQMMERIVDSEDDNGLILIREKQSRSSAKNSSATQSKSEQMTEEISGVNSDDHKNLDLTIRGKSAVSGARSTARRRN